MDLKNMDLKDLIKMLEARTSTRNKMTDTALEMLKDYVRRDEAGEKFHDANGKEIGVEAAAATALGAFTGAMIERTVDAVSSK